MTDNVGKQSEVIARNEREHDRIWNAAIEAALKALVTGINYQANARNIERLKK